MTAEDIYIRVRFYFSEITREKTGWGRDEVLAAFDKAFLRFALDKVNNPGGPNEH